MRHKTRARKALLVFPDTWLSYSPSALQAARCLEENGFSVNLIASYSESFARPGVHFDVQWVRVGTTRLGRWSRLRLRRLRQAVREWTDENGPPDLAIGFDAIGFLAAEEAGVEPVFYSLEIARDHLTRRALQRDVRHLVVQSEVRKAYLGADDPAIPTTLIQNAPILEGVPKVRRKCNQRILYLGNMGDLYALDDTVATLHHLPTYTLSLRGPDTGSYGSQLVDRHSDLVKEKRLSFNWDYIDQRYLQEYLRSYDIGICLYDFSVIHAGDVNFLTSPSGKMFSYFSAGMPVVGLDIPGLAPIGEFNAGVLVRTTDPKEIAGAISTVCSNYESFSAGAVHAAKRHDFRPAFSRFLRRMQEDGGQVERRVSNTAEDK